MLGHPCTPRCNLGDLHWDLPHENHTLTSCVRDIWHCAGPTYFPGPSHHPCISLSHPRITSSCCAGRQDDHGLRAELRVGRRGDCGGGPHRLQLLACGLRAAHASITCGPSLQPIRTPGSSRMWGRSCVELLVWSGGWALVYCAFLRVGEACLWLVCASALSVERYACATSHRIISSSIMKLSPDTVESMLASV